MADLVPPGRIEEIVGACRHDTKHLGRAVSAEKRVYVLHSWACIDSGIDLRECEFSRALDATRVRPEEWPFDVAIALGIADGALVVTGGGNHVFIAGSCTRCGCDDHDDEADVPCLVDVDEPGAWSFGPDGDWTTRDELADDALVTRPAPLVNALGEHFAASLAAGLEHPIDHELLAGSPAGRDRQ
ncbi:hypothetical protein ACFCZ3_19920 [Cellulosimicrobium cellulans]|uniref:hypothetical protein n=1 Tax=Cellulosimicrobium cellulans TaxID=1710 RepID=UPI0035DF4F12